MEKNVGALQRVEDDLGRGHTHVAIQRLSTLIQQNPADVALRSQLAAVRLQTGNLVEAGRWSYFDDVRDEAAAAAFDRAFADPRARRHALRWPPYENAPVQVRNRLLALDAEIKTYTKPSRRSGTPLRHAQDMVRTIRSRVRTIVVGLIVVDVLAAIVLGNIALVRWIA